MKKLILLIASFTAIFLFGFLYLLHLSSNRSGVEFVTKIGVIMNGLHDDRGYCQSQYDAYESIGKNSNIDIICRDRVPVNEEFSKTVDELIAEGCAIIFCDNYLYDELLLKEAKAHPNIYFLNASGTVTADNLSSFIGRTYQARYLTGIVAGMQTKTNEIGYVAAIYTPETIRQINAFAIGVRKVNSKAVVYVRNTEDWNDGEKAAETATALLDAHHIDVLTQHVNPISPLKVADGRGVYTIGNNYDNHELFPNTYLTACVFNWEPFIAERISDCQRNRFIGKHYWEGMRSGTVTLASLTPLVSKAASEMVEKERKRLESGKFDVFYGPVTDVYGTVQVREGENLSDEQLFFSMYWFVDGVVVE